MGCSVLKKEKISDAVWKDYWKQAVTSNDRVMKILSWLVAAVQLFNLWNLFVFSEKKLGTLNNRIYFSFYCVMLCASILYPVLSRLWRGNIGRMRILQGMDFSIWMFWCTGLNCYELLRSPGVDSNVIFITGLFGTAVCIQIVPWYAFLNYLIAGVGIHFMMLPRLGFGGSWNSLIGMAIAVVIVYSRFYYTIENIRNHRIIRNMNGRLREEKDKLDLSLQKYDYILRQTNNIILDWNLETDAAEFSENWSRTFGFPTVIGDFSRWISESTFVGEEERERFLREAKEALENSSGFETELLLETVSGEKRWYLFHFAYLADSQGEKKSGLGYFEDIHRHKEEISRLKFSAKTDALTGLLNRSGLYEYMRKARKGRRPGESIAMLILDADDFKSINDTYGHPCGDRALIQMAELLRAGFRQGDGLGRIGGDEFMVIFRFRGSEQAVCKKAEELAAKPICYRWKGEEITLRFSIGAAVGENESFESLYRKADSALYRVKQTNKGGFRLCHPEDEREDAVW